MNKLSLHHTFARLIWFILRRNLKKLCRLSVFLVLCLIGSVAYADCGVEIEICEGPAPVPQVVGSPVSAAFKVEQDDPALTAECAEDVSYNWTVESVVLNGTDVTSMWRNQMGLSGGGDTAGMLTAGLPAGFWGLTVKCAVSWTNSSESDCAECQGPRAATVTVAFVTVGVKRIEWKDGDTWKEGPALVPITQSVQLRVIADPTGASFPPLQPEWSSNPNLPEMQIPGSEKTFTPEQPGNYEITATAGTSLAGITVVAIGVTFTPSPVRTGYSIADGIMKIRTRITGTVTPSQGAAAVADVQLQIAGQQRVQFQNMPIRDTGAGTIQRTLRGRSATPADQEEGDCRIEAVFQGVVVGTVPVIVIVPFDIQRPFPQFEANMAGTVNFGDPTIKNLGLNNKSSPSLETPRKPLVRLCTIYGHWQTIQVVDQFNHPLNALYLGAPITESFQNSTTRGPINQFLNDQGEYQDPVGRIEYGSFVVHKDSTAAKDWPDVSPLPLTIAEVTTLQRIFVSVAGHKLRTMISRDVTIQREDPTLGRTKDQVRIVWPTTPAE